MKQSCQFSLTFCAPLNVAQPRSWAKSRRHLPSEHQHQDWYSVVWYRAPCGSCVASTREVGRLRFSSRSISEAGVRAERTSSAFEILCSARSRTGACVALAHCVHASNTNQPPKGHFAWLKADPSARVVALALHCSWPSDAVSVSSVGVKADHFPRPGCSGISLLSQRHARREGLGWTLVVVENVDPSVWL